MMEYATRFMVLSYFAPVYVLNLTYRSQKLEDGLREEVRSFIATMRIEDYSEVLEKVKLVERIFNLTQSFYERHNQSRTLNGYPNRRAPNQRQQHHND